jgi:hypothetical protein
MTDWLKDYLAGQAIQVLLADIKTGSIRSSAVLHAIQKLTKEERQEMSPALDAVYDALRWVDDSARKID